MLCWTSHIQFIKWVISGVGSMECVVMQTAAVGVAVGVAMGSEVPGSMGRWASMSMFAVAKKGKGIETSMAAAPVALESCARKRPLKGNIYFARCVALRVKWVVYSPQRRHQSALGDDFQAAARLGST